MSQNTEGAHLLLLQLCLRNFLSFGPATPPCDLSNLNVLIKPNGSGKSNLIEAFALLRAAHISPAATSKSDMRGLETCWILGIA
jgi:AAA15 family ATPase/GTPase